MDQFNPSLLGQVYRVFHYYGYICVIGYRTINGGNGMDIPTNFLKPDAWFLLIIFVYPVWMFAMILRQKKRYVAWCSKNFPNTGYTDCNWFNYYLFGYFLLLLSHIIVVLKHTNQNMLMHNFCFLLFFGFLFYNVLRQKAPALAKFYDEDGAVEEGVELLSNSQLPEYGQADTMDNKYRFVDKIPEYKVMLERWIQTEKPYMNKDFKLLDVMQALPLNRSYLSRMFNEADDETFFNFVMRFRIEECVRMLENRPDLTAARIAQICGFNSPSVFGRAFLKNVGATPKEYRNRQSMSHEIRSL